MVYMHKDVWTVNILYTLSRNNEMTCFPREIKELMMHENVYKTSIQYPHQI